MALDEIDATSRENSVQEKSEAGQPPTKRADSIVDRTLRLMRSVRFGIIMFCCSWLRSLAGGERRLIRPCRRFKPLMVFCTGLWGGLSASLAAVDHGSGLGE